RGVAEAGAPHPPAWVMAEAGERGSEPRREGMRSKQPVAEAVDGGDPRSVERTGEIGPAVVGEPRADPATQLPGRFLGVREHQDRLDVEAVVANGSGEPLDQHPRLAGPRARGDEHEALRADGLLLLDVEVH